MAEQLSSMDSDTIPSVQMSQEADQSLPGALIKPGEGIDTTRYTEPTPPTDPANASAWRGPLKAAYATQTYLAGRAEHLSALDTHGKNAWLLANFAGENMLRGYEAELKEGRAQAMQADEEGRQVQEAGQAELDVLEESWRRSLGRAFEAEIAEEELQRQILEARRALSQS